MLSLAESYKKSIEEEQKLTPEQLKTRHVGKQDPKRHSEQEIEKLTAENILESTQIMSKVALLNVVSK